MKLGWIAAFLVGLWACGAEPNQTPADAEPVIDAQETAAIATLNLEVTFTEALDARGFLHSYAFELTRCEEPLGWLERLSLVPSAWASHPLDLTANDIIIWHEALPVGDVTIFEVTQDIPAGEICGFTWLFAHGGRTYEGELASLLLRRGTTEIARSHYASEVERRFDMPIEVSDNRTLRLVLDVEQWIASFDGVGELSLATRDAWLTMENALEVQR